MSQIAPPLKFRAVGSDGLALVGGRLYSYAAGTSTPKATYTEQGLFSTNTNPVILDSRGEADVWMDGAYKFILKTAADVTIFTVDEVRDITSGQTLTGVTLAGGLIVSSTTVGWAGNPTHSGNHTWNGSATFNGNVTIGDSAADTLTIKPNLVSWTNNPTHSGNHIFGGNLQVAGTLTVSANPAGLVLGSSYTPTLTNVTNVAASTAYVCRYTRIGPNVIVSGKVSIDPTAATTDTVLDLSLPIASNLANQEDLSGTAVCPSVASYSAAILANTTSDRATLNFVVGADIANRNWYFTFQYAVI
jgi:hypothetical protein